MGDAKRRQQALAIGQPWPEDLHCCPKCRSRATVVQKAPPMGLSHVDTRLGVCRDCKTFWEAFPPDWKHDVVEAALANDRCDNCAFAAGSPEIADREGWKALLEKLKAGNEFKCHKGAPILFDAEAGTIEFDEGWVRTHGRTCAGFLRVMWNWPDWLDSRFRVLGLPERPEAEAGEVA